MSENEQTSLLVLDFGDGEREEFKAHRFANQFLLVRHIDKLFEGGYEGLVAATSLAIDQVLPEEKERLEQFLFAHGRSDSYIKAIHDGLSACWSGETKLPLDQPSTSSETTSPSGGGTSSMGGSSSPVTLEPVALIPDFAD